jgi:hypothetical protein
MKIAKKFATMFRGSERNKIWIIEHFCDSFYNLEKGDEILGSDYNIDVNREDYY